MYVFSQDYSNTPLQESAFEALTNYVINFEMKLPKITTIISDINNKEKLKVC